MSITYKQLQEAVEFFGFIGLENRIKIKKTYLELSKKYHPDNNGDSKKFQNLNMHYEVINFYMDNFQYRFTKQEFMDQFPFSQEDYKMHGII
jgi:hypothetical protein